MHRLMTGLLVFLSCATLAAQADQARQPRQAGQSPRAAQAAPTGEALPATDVTSAEIKKFIDALPRDVISDRPIQVAKVGGYQIGIYGVFRPKALAGDAILHETTTSEIYYMLKGSGVLVTGGKIAGPKPPQGNSTSPRGERIEGGVTRKVVPGDVVVIPGRTPHWWSSLDSDIEYLIFRPDPDSRLNAR